MGCAAARQAEKCSASVRNIRRWFQGVSPWTRSPLRECGICHSQDESLQNIERLAVSSGSLAVVIRRNKEKDAKMRTANPALNSKTFTRFGEVSEGAEDGKGGVGL